MKSEFLDAFDSAEKQVRDFQLKLEMLTDELSKTGEFMTFSFISTCFIMSYVLSHEMLTFDHLESLIHINVSDIFFMTVRGEFEEHMFEILPPVVNMRCKIEKKKRKENKISLVYL